MTHRFHKLELEASTSQQQNAQNESVPALGHRASAASEQLAELHDSSHWLGRADQSRRAGEFEDALRYYSRAVELDRQCVAGWVGQVRMLVALEEYAEAELWARKALELFRNHADLHSARAHALCRSGDLKNAQVACDAAIGQQGQSPYPWMARGDLMLARKDPIADHCFDKAIQLDPDWIIAIEIAAIYLYYRRPAKALARCTPIVEKAPDQPYAWYHLGVCQLEMSLEKPARRSFARCLDLEPRHQRARAALRRLDHRDGLLKRTCKRLFGFGN